MTIQAIETRYAGCRFRSRLEARWAVFFDRLDIKWEYESQGVTVSSRLSLSTAKFPYLPDFWLPELGLWTEVKGSLDVDETLKLLNAAASLSSNDGSGCHDSGGNDVVVLGPVPRVRPLAIPGFIATDTPWRLHMHKGDLMAAAWSSDSPEHGSGCVAWGADIMATDFGGSFEDITKSSWWKPEVIPNVLTNGCGLITKHDDMYVVAIKAARSARFEHGEAG